MTHYLQQLIRHETLSKDQTKSLMYAIAESRINPSQIASLLTLYMMRPITLEELKGFREALMDMSLKIDLGTRDTIDLCGTGGDGKNTFNISTLASFVTAASGVPVTKHGNYGLSSISGSSNVLENLGIQFSNKTDYLKRCLDEANICILHAPMFHPAMKSVATTRKELGVKTIFNYLGPLVNPVQPKYQMTGVSNLELARMYTYFFQQESQDFSIVHALDGYDEVSLTGTAKIISNTHECHITAESFGVQRTDPESIYGGQTAQEAAQIFVTILEGKGTAAQNNVVCANAAIAIQNYTKKSFEDCFSIAKENLLNGNANICFEKLKNIKVS